MVKKKENKDLLPPSAVDVEMVVIGSVMIDQDAKMIALRMLSEEIFYRRDHQIIFKMFEYLEKKNREIDLLTVSDIAKKSKHELELGYLTDCIGHASSSSTKNIEYHCSILIEKFKLRRAQDIANDLIADTKSGQEEASTILALAQKKLVNLGRVGDLGKEIIHIKEAQQIAMDKLDEDIKTNAEFCGVSTGNLFLDKMFGGYDFGNLYFIAGRPGFGKTTMALINSYETAKLKTPVLFLSLEMTKSMLIHKIWSYATRLDSELFKKPQTMSDEFLATLTNQLSGISELPFYIDDTPRMTIDNISFKLMDAVPKFGIKLVVIDYLTLIRNPREKDIRLKIADISETLKALAKELNIAIVCLSQLNREVDNTANSRSLYRPRMTHFKESGSPEQDADGIILLYCPKYYSDNELLSITENYNFGQGVKGSRIKGVKYPIENEDKDELIEVKVAKNRFGKVGTGYFYWCKKNSHYKWHK